MNGERGGHGVRAGRGVDAAGRGGGVPSSGKWLLLLRNGESQRFPATRDHFRKRVN